MRRQTNLAKYGITNVRNLRRHNKPESYNNLKYMQSCDKRFANMLLKYGVNVWQPREEITTEGCNQILDAAELSVYVSTDYGLNAFLTEFGMNNTRMKRRGVTLSLVKNNLVYQAIRVEVSRIKNFSYQLSNIGTRTGFTVNGGLEKLFNKALDLYQFDSIIAIIPENDDLLRIGFIKQFNRPLTARWKDGSICRRTDCIEERLANGDQLITSGNCQAVYTFSTAQ